MPTNCPLCTLLASHLITSHQVPTSCVQYMRKLVKMHPQSFCNELSTFCFCYCTKYFGFNSVHPILHMHICCTVASLELGCTHSGEGLDRQGDLIFAYSCPDSKNRLVEWFLVCLSLTLKKYPHASLHKQFQWPLEWEAQIAIKSRSNDCSVWTPPHMG